MSDATRVEDKRCFFALCKSRKSPINFFLIKTLIKRASFMCPSYVQSTNRTPTVNVERSEQIVGQHLNSLVVCKKGDFDPEEAATPYVNKAAKT